MRRHLRVAAAALLSTALPAGAAEATRPPGASTGLFAPPPGAAALVPVPIGTAELLAVQVNGIDQDGDVFVWRLTNGAFAVPVNAMRAWRLAIPPAPPLRIDGGDAVRLDAIPGLTARVDAAKQMLLVDVPASAFLRSGIEVVVPAVPLDVPRTPGAWFNYDLNAQLDKSASSPLTRAFGALLDVGVAAGESGGRTSVVARSATYGSGVTRLDTTWQFDSPGELTSLQIGDTVGATGQWGRTVRFGGVRWSTDFSTRPGFVAFPLPGIRGEATVPSVVDLYVNNAHQLQGNVPAGAFDVPDVPVVTGQGQIRMVVRDALGREQVVVQPYYVTPSLLRPGLHDWSLEAGVVRENYGLDSFTYGRALAVATDRAGVTATFTRELRLELQRRQQTAGAGAVFLVDNAATVNLSAAASRSDAGAGALLTAGVERQSSGWSASLQSRFSTPRFAQIGQSFAGAPPPRFSFNASGATVIGAGGVGLNALVQSDWQGGRFQSFSANYGTRVGVLGYASVYASRTTGSSRGWAVGCFLTQSFGSDTSATEGFFRSKDRTVSAGASAQTPSTQSSATQATVQLQSSPPVGPGFGYRVLAEGGDQRRGLVEGVWQIESAAFNAGVGRYNASESARLGASGGVAIAGGSVFMARRIEGSYAVVDVGGYPNVRVTRDNQVVARTDSSGRAFVAGLRGFENNRIGIEAGDLPLDAQVDALDMLIAPPARSGVAVRIPVNRGRSALLRVVDAEGLPLPPGSLVQGGDSPRDFPVGFEGRLFLTGTLLEGRYTARWPTGSCTFAVEWRQSEDEVPDLGTHTCR